MNRHINDLVLGVVSVALWSCAGAGEGEASEGTTNSAVDDDMIDQRVELAPPQEGSVRIQLPELIVPAGEELQTCWVADWVAEEDTLVEALVTYQGSMGHHLAVLASVVPREPGEVFDCTQLESMTNLRPAVLPDTVHQGDEVSEVYKLPDNFAVRVPANTTLVFQSHYVNVSNKDAVTADVADLRIVPPSDEVIETSYFILNDARVDIAPGTGSRNLHCNVEHDDLNLLVMFGHMHDWGTSISIEHEGPEGRNVLWEEPEWRVDYRDAPPITVFDPSSPMSMHVGDRMNLNCNYNNDTGEPLRFPTEMCVAVALYYPAIRNEENGVILCDEQYD